MKLKYSGYFLAFIIIAKVIYLFVEIYYNTTLIDTINSLESTKESLKYLESLGHNISSVGFTLLVTPFLYLVYKKFIPKATPYILSISMIVLFFSFHAALTSLMDKIIEDNKDKRYSSYYISGFKYGMLNNVFGYESFIPHSHFNYLNTTDKVILSNIFLLNYIDESIINKLINDGQEQIIDTFIFKNHKHTFRQDQDRFEDEAKKIIDGYNSYIDKSRELNRNFAKVDNATVLNAEYRDFTGKLRTKYAEYEKKVIKFEKSTTLSEKQIDTTYEDLSKYFKYQSYSKAQRQYKEKMNAQFGHYIDPDRWCSGGYCPTRNAIENVVYEEGYKKFKKRSGGIPADLSQRGFYKYPKVKKKVIKELRSKGLMVSNYFNYSKKQFAKAYKVKVNKEFKLAKKRFLKELKAQTGKKMRFGLNYKQFVYYFKSDFTKRYGKKDGIILYNMVKRKDTTNFYETFYKPKIKREHLREYLLSKKDFQTRKYAQKGDNSIKHLYIPPFAIAMSLIAGILNFVSVVSMLLVVMFKIDRFEPITQFILKNIMKLAILSLVVLYPFYEMKNSDILKEYKALEKIKEIEHGQEYLELLKWIIVYEKKIIGD